MHKDLFIPGPTEVMPEVLQAMATPQIGHRSKDFVALYERVMPKLKKVLYTEQSVFLFPSSSTGAMEAAVRNCSSKKILSCVVGAFSDRWNKIAIANGKEADRLEIEWGKAMKPEMIDKALSTGKYDAVTFVHNETSTGVMSPIEEVAAVMKKYPDVMFLVDAVSSMSGYKLETDKLGTDVCLAGVQKCWALPSGLTIVTVSNKALEKAKTVENRGYYFDFLDYLKYDSERHQTPSTPAISHIFALDVQLDRFLTEGIENRFKRHSEMAKIVREWAKKHFALFAESGYESETLTTIKNTREISVADLNKELGNRGYQISNRYGKLKEKTFRIAHMGDHTVADIKKLLGVIDEILGL